MIDLGRSKNDDMDLYPIRMNERAHDSYFTCSCSRSATALSRGYPAFHHFNMYFNISLLLFDFQGKEPRKPRALRCGAHFEYSTVIIISNA